MGPPISHTQSAMSLQTLTMEEEAIYKASLKLWNVRGVEDGMCGVLVKACVMACVCV